MHNDEFCIQNDELSIKHDDLCIENDELSIKHDDLCIENDESSVNREDYFPGSVVSFSIKMKVLNGK